MTATKFAVYSGDGGVSSGLRRAFITATAPASSVFRSRQNVHGRFNRLAGSATQHDTVLVAGSSPLLPGPDHLGTILAPAIEESRLRWPRHFGGGNSRPRFTEHFAAKRHCGDGSCQ